MTNRKAKRKERFTSVAMFLVITLTALGIFALFKARFASGDIYPVYSSLRPDPLGCEVFYEAVNASDGITATRNHRDYSKLNGSTNRTLLLIGADPFFSSGWSNPDTRRFVRRGGRLVIAFMSWADEGSFSSTGTGIFVRVVGTNAIAIGTNTFAAASNTVSALVGDSWLLPYTNMALTGEGWAYVNSNTYGGTLPAKIPCRTRLLFDDPGTNWTTAYSRHGQPVMISRTSGKGEIILATTSYLFSNEAMQEDRHSALLSWLIGGRREVIFDETLRGSIYGRGISSLLRQYSLEWAILASLLVALVLIWKNASGLLPRGHSDDPETDSVPYQGEGPGAVSGLSNLLRVNIPSKTILQEAYEEWLKTAGKDYSKDKVDRVEQLLADFSRSKTDQATTLRTYDAITRILGE